MLEKNGYPETMPPQASDLRTIDLDRILSLLRRQALVLGLCVVLAMALAGFYLALAPRSYLSASQILIDRNLQQVVSEEATPTSSVDLEAQVLNQIEVLRSSRVARSVAVSQNLMTDQEFLNPPPSFTQRVRGMLRGLLAPFGGGEPARPATLEASVDEVVGMLRANVQVDRMGRSSIIRVGYEAATPALAQRIASAYADALVQDQLNAELEATSAASEWLQQRLAEIGESQRQASLAIEQYREESGLTVGQDANLTTQRIEALSSQLAEGQAETARLRALSNQLLAIVAAGPQSASNYVSLLSGTQTDPAEISALRSQAATLDSRIAQVTEAYGADHPQLTVLSAEKAALDGRVFALLQNLAEQYQTQLAIAQQQEVALRGNIDGEGANAGLVSQEQVRLNELQQRSDALRALYNSYLTRYEESVQRQSFPIPSVRVVTDALLPESPSSPRTLVILAAAILLGGFAGVLLGTLNELRERGFRTGAQVRQQLGLRFLGYLPRLQLPEGGEPGHNQRSVRTLVRAALGQRLGRRWGLPYLETLKTARLAINPRAEKRTALLGVLSVLPGEGKTIFALSLAEMLAATGHSVLLVDADGGAGAAAGDSGPATLSTRELAIDAGDLGNPRLQAALHDARGRYDYVIVDLPALGPVIDALAVLPFLDGSVLVSEWGRTPRRLVRSMLEHEPDLGDHLIGVVLNKVDLGALPKFTDVGGLERFAYRRERRVEELAETAP